MIETKGVRPSKVMARSWVDDGWLKREMRGLISLTILKQMNE